MSKKTSKKKVGNVIEQKKKNGENGKIVKLESDLKRKSVNTSIEECDGLKLWDKLVDVLVQNELECAISANEIGVLKNAILVCEFEDGKVKSQTKFINPIIMDTKDLTVNKGETCISYPGRKLDVVRYGWILIKDDLNGNKIYTGHMAFVLQHCVDHLNGIVFIDREIEKPKKEIRKEHKREVKKEIKNEIKNVKESKSKKSDKKQRKLNRKLRRKRKTVKETVRHGSIKARR